MKKRYFGLMIFVVAIIGIFLFVVKFSKKTDAQGPSKYGVDVIKFNVPISAISDGVFAVKGSTSGAGPDAYGVWGESTNGSGVVGTSIKANGVYGSSKNDYCAGVYGVSDSDKSYGVMGVSDYVGVYGSSAKGNGVCGASWANDGAAISGNATGINGFGGYFESQRGYALSVKGTAWCENGNWSGSDIRLKKNVVTIDNSLDKIIKLRGVYFEWKEDKNKTLQGKQIGLIGQEVQKVVPEAVTINYSSKEKYLGVAYDRIVPLLIEGIKTQQTEIDELKADQKRTDKEIQELKKAILSIKSGK
jgi:hypothetical protein